MFKNLAIVLGLMVGLSACMGPYGYSGYGAGYGYNQTCLLRIRLQHAGELWIRLQRIPLLTCCGPADLMPLTRSRSSQAKGRIARLL